MGALPFRWTAATAFLLAATLVAAGVASAANPHVDTARITILQTTDLHDHANGIYHTGLDVDPVHGTAVTGSYARIAAYVEQVRSEAHWPVVLVDSGDWTMGTIYDLTLAGDPLALNFLDRLRYDCVTLGNHEFDYRTAGLAQMLAAAQAAFDFHTPIVASNMKLNGDADLAPYAGAKGAIRPTFVETVQGGLRVGYVGLMGRDAARYTEPLSAPITFDDPTQNYAAIQALVNGLRTRADIVIALSHSGTDPTGTSGEDVELARHVTGIDVIASGHTHTPLDHAHAITNGAWTTQIIDAGAFGSNVARIDLAYDRMSRSSALLGSSNADMSDAGLATIAPSLASDPFYNRLVNEADFALNGGLGSLFMRWFSDYDPADLGAGIYHPVAVAAQDMAPEAANRLPPPNGLGDLVADGLRAAPNALLAETLAGIGGDPQNLPGYDFTPFQAGLVVNVSLRGKLLAAVPSTFTDVYNLLSIGISPDPAQALQPGAPLISVYIDAADVRKLCALQVVAQSNASLADSYLHLSGISCTLKPLETYVYFKYDTATGVLQVTSQKATAGSTLAGAALGALVKLAIDHGAALLAARAAGNPYATAMVNLNDSSPDSAQIAANLAALGQVAAAAAADQANGTIQLVSLIVAKAIAAIDTLSAFATDDVENVGVAAPVSDAQRVRFALDLTTVGLLAGAAQRFGTAVTPYRHATGSETLISNLPGVLASRIDADPVAGGVQELKAWMALLWYVQTGLQGQIGGEYASTATFTQFPTFGLAVKTRSASYPLAGISQYAATIGALLLAP